MWKTILERKENLSTEKGVDKLKVRMSCSHRFILSFESDVGNFWGKESFS